MFENTQRQIKIEERPIDVWDKLFYSKKERLWCDDRIFCLLYTMKDKKGYYRLLPIRGSAIIIEKKFLEQTVIKLADELIPVKRETPQGKEVFIVVKLDGFKVFLRNNRTTRTLTTSKFCEITGYNGKIGKILGKSFEL